jgi:glycosyltransferase involved in cell wall biosynthesis
MRIVMIGPFGMSPKGTMRVRALPLAQALAARGHRVALVMPPWHTPEEAGRVWEEGGVTLEYVTLGPHLPLLSYVLVTLRLVRRGLAHQPDVIHCFKPKAYAGLAAWLLWHLKRLGVVRARLVVDEDDWEGPGGWNDLGLYSRLMRAFFTWQERWGLRHNDAVTVASRALQTLAWSLGISGKRVFYMPNGAVRHVAADEQKGPDVGGAGLPEMGPARREALGRAVRQRHGLGEAPVVLLYTRFFEYDVARVVDVWRRIAQELLSAQLLVVGVALFPEDDARFDQLVGEAGLTARVVRAGWVSQQELLAHFAAADVAIYPFDDTLVNRCKCAVKLIDLLAAGMPVVADAVGQNAEYIAHNETGVLVPSGNTKAMAAAALRLLREEPKRRVLGDAAAARMAACYAWAGLADRALSAYGVSEGSSPGN